MKKQVKSSDATFDFQMLGYVMEVIGAAALLLTVVLSTLNTPVAAAVAVVIGTIFGFSGLGFFAYGSSQKETAQVSQVPSENTP